MEYLRHKGQFQNEEEAPMPGLILMDLYMPRMDGLTALKEIRADSKLCKIPLVVLSTSKSDKDIHESYELGAIGYIQKPVSFEALFDVLQTSDKSWFRIVESIEP